MIDLLKSFPPVPGYESNDSYILYFSPSAHKYALRVYNNEGKSTLTDTEWETLSRFYTFDTEHKSWTFNNASPGFLSQTGYKAIASSNTVYNSNGELVIRGVHDYDSVTVEFSVLGDTITSNTLYDTLSDVFTLAPILILVVVALVGFRKAWRFIHGAVRGA